MNTPDARDALLRSQLKGLVASMFRLDILEPETIGDYEPLADGRFCTDSLDSLELAICVEEQFGIALRSGEELRRAFATLASLANHLRSHSPSTAGEVRRRVKARTTAEHPPRQRTPVPCQKPLLPAIPRYRPA